MTGSGHYWFMVLIWLPRTLIILCTHSWSGICFGEDSLSVQQIYFHTSCLLTNYVWTIPRSHNWRGWLLRDGVPVSVTFILWSQCITFQLAAVWFLPMVGPPWMVWPDLQGPSSWYRIQSVSRFSFWSIRCLSLKHTSDAWLPWNHSILALLYLWSSSGSSWVLSPLLIPSVMVGFTPSPSVPSLSLLTASLRLSQGDPIYSHAFKKCCLSIPPGQLRSPQTPSLQWASVLPTKHVSNWTYCLLQWPQLLSRTSTNRCTPLPLFPSQGMGLLAEAYWLPGSHPVTPSPSTYLSITESCWFYLSYISQLCPICPLCDHQGSGHHIFFGSFLFLPINPIVTFQWQSLNSSDAASN